MTDPDQSTDQSTDQPQHAHVVADTVTGEGAATPPEQEH